MAEPTKPRRVAVPKKGVTPRGSIAVGKVDPARSTGGKALGKTKGKAQGKAVGHSKPQPKSLGPETAAVRKKYAGALDMRKEAAAGKGAKGKAGLIAWKRSSGYQKDWNAAKANDASAAAHKRLDPMPMRPMPPGTKVGTKAPGSGDRLDFRQGAKPGSGVEEFRPIGAKSPDRMDFRQGAKPGSGVEEPQPIGAAGRIRATKVINDVSNKLNTSRTRQPIKKAVIDDTANQIRKTRVPAVSKRKGTTP